MMRRNSCRSYRNMSRLSGKYYITICSYLPNSTSITAPANTCNAGTAFTLPSVTAISGFTVQWSINGGAYTASPTVPTTAGCHTLKARYVLTSSMRSICNISAGTAAPAGCLESNLTVSVVIFPAAPSLTVPAIPVCAYAFTLPIGHCSSRFYSTIQYQRSERIQLHRLYNYTRLSYVTGQICINECMRRHSCRGYGTCRLYWKVTQYECGYLPNCTKYNGTG
jgi:hypothetical protein